MESGTGSRSRGLRAVIAVSRFNEMITERLRDGAIQALVRHGIGREDIEIVEVSGAFEVPQALRIVASRPRKPDLMVGIAAILKGETVHHQVLANAVVNAIEQVAIDTGIPTGLGVITTDTVAQAMERSGGARGNKGEEAALAALGLARWRRAS